MHDLYRRERINLAGDQGNENFELPVMGTYILGKDGMVAHAHVDLDFTKRQDSHGGVAILEELSKA